VCEGKSQRQSGRRDKAFVEGQHGLRLSRNRPAAQGRTSQERRRFPEWECVRIFLLHFLHARGTAECSRMFATLLKAAVDSCS
jgi:hypothetical protein